MSGLKSFDKMELSLYIKEVERYISKGLSLEEVANELQWRVEDVRELVESKVFKDTVDPDLLASLNLQSIDGTELVKEAVDFANRRVLRYMQHLDELAEKANSEQVRLAAVTKLLSFTRLAGEASQQEPFNISEDDIKRFIEASREVYGRDGTDGHT